MADGAIVFAMANPTPEVQPEEVRADVAIMATGRSDYPNQINNVLAFPGVFRGALDVRATTINEEMKLAAARGDRRGRSRRTSSGPSTSSPASSTGRSRRSSRRRSRAPPSAAASPAGRCRPRRRRRHASCR